MMQTFVQRLCPTALSLPNLTKKWLSENLEKVHLGFLKQTSSIILYLVTRAQTFPNDPLLANFRFADNLPIESADHLKLSSAKLVYSRRKAVIGWMFKARRAGM